MDTRLIVKRGRYTGRIAKNKLIQLVMQEEHQAGKKIECKRIMLLAQKKLEQYPQQLRDAAKLSLKDYRNALELFNKNPGEIPLAETNGEAPVKQSEVIQPGEVNFTKEELLKASQFYRFCGMSLSRAKQLLDFIYLLTRES